MASSTGRLVLNHSTHIPGLIAILDRLTQAVGVQTITPGVIGPVRSHTPKMTLKVSVPIRGGFKLIARKGKTVQEVFIIASLEQAELEAAIAEILAR
jgi:hypothetical protein